MRFESVQELYNFVYNFKNVSKFRGRKKTAETTAWLKRSFQAQRIASSACANATVHFLRSYRLAMLLPPSE